MAGFIANFFGGASSSAASAPARRHGTGSNTSGAPATYSLERFEQLYCRLRQFQDVDMARGGGDSIVETVRLITEALVWGEQNDTDTFFFHFAEKGMLGEFVRLLGVPKAQKKVKMQLLQTLSMLVQNIRRQESVYYLLSNNHVNRLIETTFDFSDEEILAYYVTLMKSLAMRLDSETIKFFFIQHPEPHFPLYIEATKLFNHSDQMVSATVRTITLQVYKIEDAPMRRFVLRHAAERYFSQLAYYLREIWLRLAAVVKGAQGNQDFSALQRENELQQDLQIYLSDVFELNVVELNEVLADRLLNCTMLPLLLTVVTGTAVEDQSTGRAQMMVPSVALFLIRQVLEIFHSPVLLGPLFSALLQPCLPAAVAYAITQAVQVDGLDQGQVSLPTAFEDSVPNALRGPFLDALRSSEDTIFLLSTIVVHGCIRHRHSLPASFLATAGILPFQEARDAPPGSPASPSDVVLSIPDDASEEEQLKAAIALSLASAPPQDDASEEEQLKAAIAVSLASAPPQEASDATEDAAQPGTVLATTTTPALDVLWLLIEVLQRCLELEIDYLRVFVRIILDIFLDPAVYSHMASRGAALRAVHAMQQKAGSGVLDFLKDNRDGEGTAATRDRLLDAFAEEWELHKAPLASVTDFFGNPRWLLPPPVEAPSPKSSSSGHDARSALRKNIARFLLLRRLLRHFVEHAPPPSPPESRAAPARPCAWSSPSDEQTPLHIEQQAADEFREGMSFDMGSVDRIVCGVSLQNGKRTRYLVLHDFWLMLVQPDVAMPNHATVKTLWPVWQVQSLIDRSDPRTLQLGMHSLGGAGLSPGEAVASNPATRTYFTLTLNFEDVNKCHDARTHLLKCRDRVRAVLAPKVTEFVSACCREPQPQLAL